MQQVSNAAVCVRLRLGSHGVVGQEERKQMDGRRSCLGARAHDWRDAADATEVELQVLALGHGCGAPGRSPRPWTWRIWDWEPPPDLFSSRCLLVRGGARVAVVVAAVARRPGQPVAAHGAAHTLDWERRGGGRRPAVEGINVEGGRGLGGFF